MGDAREAAHGSFTEAPVHAAGWGTPRRHPTRSQRSVPDRSEASLQRAPNPPVGRISSMHARSALLRSRSAAAASPRRAWRCGCRGSRRCHHPAPAAMPGRAGRWSRRGRRCRGGGHAAIQLARRSGADVITTVSSPAKAAFATAAGAHHVVDYRGQGAYRRHSGCGGWRKRLPGLAAAPWSACPDPQGQLS